MTKIWKNLPVAKKLYSVVGVMALLIATELFTLMFAMDILSAVRSFVGGEGIWSKAQKNAIYNLHRYSQTADQKYWQAYLADLKISQGDHNARVEMETPSYDRKKVIDGFVQGGNNRDDSIQLERLLRRFYWVSYITHALELWREADSYVGRMNDLALQLHAVMEKPKPRPAEIESVMQNLDQLNDTMTEVEIHFSEVLGEGSRWLEHNLMILLLLAVLTVESTGLFLTISFGRKLSRTLQRMMERMQTLGRGDFSQQLIVDSDDELGRLAQSINHMSRELSVSLGERVQAQNESQSKTMFLANTSHEIRTPLGVMLGLIEILKDRGLSPSDYRHHLETMERTGKNLLRIINDILDISKVEAGHLEIEKTRFPIEDLVAELQTMLSMQSSKNKNSLRIEVRDSEGDDIVTDRVRLRQILVNLIGNALKYTENGKVEVGVKAEAGKFTVDVKDSGRGISLEDQKRLFQVFERGSNVAGASDGSGLGLVLSRRLAQALGGDLRLVHSEVGIGSQFRVEIPVEILARETAPGKPAPVVPADALAIKQKLTGKSILVVEDSEDNRLLVQLFLHRLGMTVTFAENGMEGLQRALAGNFDAVLMDMQMPVMDGYKATAQLRQLGFKSPIIALTAHAMKDDRARCLDAGCNEYLTKPINSELLFTTLASQIL